jgi:hypothetical protein
VGNPDCWSSDTAIITLLDPAVPEWVDAGDDQTLDSRTFTDLQGSAPTGVIISWSVLSGTGEFSDATEAQCTVTGLSIGMNILKLEAMYPNGCASASDTMAITVNDIFIPEAFSPNGDGAYSIAGARRSCVERAIPTTGSAQPGTANPSRMTPTSMS